jgi:hypothetical protein
MKVQTNMVTPAGDGQMGFQDDATGMGRALNARTYVCQVGCVLGGNMTEAPCSFLNFGGRGWVIRIDVLDGAGEIDKILGKIAKQQTHKRLQRTSVSDGLYGLRSKKA